jgi:hypothetical protein
VSLNLAETAVKDLTPLRGMGLIGLNLHGTPVEDLWPLLTLPWLEDLEIGKTPAAMKPLPAFPERVSVTIK